MTMSQQSHDAGPEAVWRALGCELRRWMLIAISEQPMCGIDLCRLLGAERYVISRHLRPLRELGWLVERKDQQSKVLRLTRRIAIEREGERVSITAMQDSGEELILRFSMHPDVARRFDEYHETRQRVARNA